MSINYSKKHWILFILAILLTITLFYIAHKANAETIQSSYTEIEVHNVYSLNVRIELKCDYNNNTKQFDLHRFYEIPGKKVAVITVPNRYKKCQIWPKLKFLGE